MSFIEEGKRFSEAVDAGHLFPTTIWKDMRIVEAHYILEDGTVISASEFHNRKDKENA